MSSDNRRALTQRIGVRLAACMALGALVALASMAYLERSLAFHVMAGWTAAATIYGLWTWLTVRPMNEHEAAEHAREEDPSVALSEATVIGGTVASLAGVGLLLAAGQHKSSGTPEALLGAGSVVASWFLVHLTYMTRYARLSFERSARPNRSSSSSPRVRATDAFTPRSCAR